MKLLSVRLENFRGYQDLKFDVSQSLHMIVGMNDIGKSSIFEALDNFFNATTAQSKLSNEDFCVKSTEQADKKISITCEFSVADDEKVIIDATNEILPKDEYLLNANGNIEIKKTWNCGGAKVTTKTELVCSLPTCIDATILSMKIGDLKTKLTAVDPNSTVNRSIKAEIRKAIYAKLLEANPNPSFVEVLVDTKSVLDEKDFYSSLEKSLPDFYLFKADRRNTTSDEEVQDPLNIAVKTAMADERIKLKLQEIEEIVKQELNETNAATIEQMKKFSNRLGNSLTAKINTDWNKAVKNDVLDRNNIPINKKGSGIRRLLLLSYLMVQAEKKSALSNKKEIIYAIEEPETSLHPNMQKQFIEHLIYITSRDSYVNGDEVPSNIDELLKYKVLLTTHLPNYLAYVNQDQVIYISENDDGNPIEITGDDEYKKIKDELGLLPSPYYGFVIFVEGDNDKNFLLNLNKVQELREIFDLTAEEVNIIPLKGSNLLKSIEHDFYKDLPVKQFHLYDSDVAEYVDLLNNNIIGQNEKWDGIATIRKCMEYYIPKALIEVSLGIDLDPYTAQWADLDFDLIDTMLSLTSTMLTNLKKDKEPKKSLKAFMNKTIAKAVSKANLEEHGVFEEIKTWFSKMKILKEI